MVWTQLIASRAHLGDIKETPIAAAVAGRLEIEEVDQEDRRKDDRTLHRQPIAFSAGMPSLEYVRTSTPLGFGWGRSVRLRLAKGKATPRSEPAPSLRWAETDSRSCPRP